MEAMSNNAYTILLGIFLFFLIALSIFSLFICFSRMQFVKEVEVFDENDISHIQQTPLTRRLRRIMQIRDPERHTPTSATRVRSEVDLDSGQRPDRVTHGV